MRWAGVGSGGRPEAPPDRLRDSANHQEPPPPPPPPPPLLPPPLAVPLSPSRFPSAASKAAAASARAAGIVPRAAVSEFEPGGLSAFSQAVRRRDDRRRGRRPPQPRRGRARTKMLLLLLLLLLKLLLLLPPPPLKLLLLHLLLLLLRRRPRQHWTASRPFGGTRLERGQQPRRRPLQARRRRKTPTAGGRLRARCWPMPSRPHREVRRVGRGARRQQRPRCALRRAQAGAARGTGGRVLRRSSVVSPGRSTFKLPAAAVECRVDPGQGRRRRPSRRMGLRLYDLVPNRFCQSVFY